MYSFHTVLTSITSKQTKWVSCELHAYPFKSIDGISSFDATFFSEEPENFQIAEHGKTLEEIAARSTKK